MFGPIAGTLAVKSLGATQAHKHVSNGTGKVLLAQSSHFITRTPPKRGGGGGGGGVFACIN